MRQFIVYSSVLCSLWLSGCIIVPVPHKRMHEYGVNGLIIDAGSRSPVAGARVEDTVDPKKFTFSVIDGTFALLPVYAWHGGYILAGVSGSVFPEFTAPGAARTITVSAPGYRSVTIPLSKPSESKAHDLYIDAGTIPLKR